MKFLHTSDLHIGLRLCEVSMNAEIVHLLHEIAGIAVDHACDAVVIAGDIYDRSNPTAEASALFDNFVTELAEKNIAVLAVSGNHDSPERVAYLSRLTEGRGVYFSPVFDGTVREVTFSDALGEVVFHLLPFVRPVNVRALTDTEAVTYHDAMAALIGGIHADDGRRHVMVTHQFVIPGGGEIRIPEDAEEHAIAGGIGAVGADLFDKFAYTALGHLHRPHFVGSQLVNFSGSPVKCSFSEVDDEKSVTVVTLEEEAVCERILLHPIRDLREMRGTYEEITSLGFRAKGNPEDYLRIILTDEEDIPDAVAKLRTIYPNLLRLNYDNRRTKNLQEIANPERDGESLTPLSVFAELYEMQNNAPPSEELLAIAGMLFEESQKEEAL